MLAEYLLAAEYEPTNPAWQAEIGNAYIKRGDLVAALAAYQHATELAPNKSTYWSLLAVFCAENSVYLEEWDCQPRKRRWRFPPMTRLRWMRWAGLIFLRADMPAPSRFCWMWSSVSPIICLRRSILR